MAAEIPNMADANVPWIADPNTFRGRPSGRINVGDYLTFSAGRVIATDISDIEDALPSAAGIALQPNPIADWYGIEQSADTINVMRAGQIWVRASAATASAEADIGARVYPVATGSAYNSPTGHDGSAALWAKGTFYHSGGASLGSALGTIIDARGGATAPEWLVLFDINSLNQGVRNDS